MNKNYKIKIKPNTKEFAILSILKEHGEMILDAMLPRQYPEAMLWRKILGLENKNKISKKKELEIYKTLIRLKEKGLVKKEGELENVIWKISNNGIKIVSKIKIEKLPEKDGKIRIIIFDIPEEYRNNRVWLRKELINSDYKLLQRSVWIGKRPLPERIFLKMKDLNILDNIYIFEVKEVGMLNKIDL